MALFGGFLLMNLTLAVVWLSYDREKTNSHARLEEKERLRRRAALKRVIFQLFQKHREADNLPSDWSLRVLARIDNLHGRLLVSE